MLISFKNESAVSRIMSQNNQLQSRPAPVQKSAKT